MNTTFKNQNSKYPHQTIVVELTGSPKESTGYATKAEFVNQLNSNRRNVTIIRDTVKNANLLIADSYDANTQKIRSAKKNGVEILTYRDALKRFQMHTKFYKMNKSASKSAVAK